MHETDGKKAAAEMIFRTIDAQLSQPHWIIV